MQSVSRQIFVNVKTLVKKNEEPILLDLENKFILYSSKVDVVIVLSPKVL